MDDLGFQQDVVTCQTINLLKENFFSALSPFVGLWRRSRSCDFTLVYFLWGYVKSLIYADKPETIIENWEGWNLLLARNHF